jgi:hypothetical protein
MKPIVVFLLKTVAKLVNGHKQIYIINETMRAELDFIRQALNDDSGFLSKCLVLPSLFQRPQRHLCLGIALSFPVEDTPLTFEYGGTCHSLTK